MPTLTNQLIAQKANIRRDIFRFDGAHPVCRSEMIDPRETFPILAGTVLARATDSKLLIRYVDATLPGADPAANGNDVVVGMLLDEVRQPAEILSVGGRPVAVPADLVIHAVAPNAVDIANLTANAKTQLAALGVYAYTAIA